MVKPTRGERKIERGWLTSEEALREAKALVELEVNEDEEEENE